MKKKQVSNEIIL